MGEDSMQSVAAAKACALALTVIEQVELERFEATAAQLLQHALLQKHAARRDDGDAFILLDLKNFLHVLPPANAFIDVGGGSFHHLQCLVQRRPVRMSFRCVLPQLFEQQAVTRNTLYCNKEKYSTSKTATVASMRRCSGCLCSISHLA
jgi:hypothetical protein